MYFIRSCLHFFGSLITNNFVISIIDDKIAMICMGRVRYHNKTKAQLELFIKASTVNDIENKTTSTLNIPIDQNIIFFLLFIRYQPLFINNLYLFYHEK